ncbi:hypothetical protein Taro_026902 [Colocasia esculenta]|uniref:Uncharacterized protein n=1 Tax=Colocasia esculenta TaxID=4460 RepID=A0A843VD50_COLES|nr:hypothetical protein [Colocasia esculenta]
MQESLGLFHTGREVAESVDEQLQRLTEGFRERLASEPGAQADVDLRCFLTFFLGRLLFAKRSNPVHCLFLPLLEDLGQIGRRLSAASPLSSGLGLPTPPWLEEGDFGATGPRAHSSALGAVS